MMKRLLVLTAGILQVPVIKKAVELGYYVIAADGNPNAVGLQYANKPVIANILSEADMLSVAREEHIDGVIHPCSEVAMHVMGRINDELNLHGIGMDTVVRATNKHLMRQAFEVYGAPSPLSFCAKDSALGWDILQSEFYGDAILKPSRNSGSRGIAKINYGIMRQDFDLLFERAKKESKDNSVMIEQFVNGPEFSVEIIVWEGCVNVIQITDKKTTGSPYFVELGHSQPSMFPMDVVAAVKKAAVKGVKALNLDNCAAHAEVKYDNGRAYIMEIGARLGGDFISTELVHLSTGIDMVAAAINVAMGIEPQLNPTEEPRGVCIRYFCPTPGTLQSIIGIEELKHNPHIYDYNIYRHIGDTIPAVRSSLDRSGHVIVTDITVKQAVERAENILSKVKFNIK